MGRKKLEHPYTEFETWHEKFKPVANHIDEDASWDGAMFETYGDEELYIEKMCRENPRKVWTLVEDDYGFMCITNGWHYVNRIGYFITENEFEEGADFNVYDEDDIKRILRRERQSRKLAKEANQI